MEEKGRMGRGSVLGVAGDSSLDSVIEMESQTDHEVGDTGPGKGSSV